MEVLSLISDWPEAAWRDRRVVLGVSGGADSIALLLAMHEVAMPGRLVVAHLNHGWRGAESDGDADFVAELCARLDRACVVQLLRDRDKKDWSQSDASGSRDSAMLAKASVVPCGAGQGEVVAASEQLARAARYDFFRETAYDVGASYVVTAHTADDRIETLLHNLLRGAGLAGATSLTMFRPFHQDLVLVRPLLRKRRSEIEAFLSARGQAFRNDSTNSQTRFRRNFLRHQVLPQLADHYPAAAESLLNFSELAEELSADLECLADRWLDRAARPAQSTSTQDLRPSSRIVLAQAEVCAEPWTIVHYALRRLWLHCGWPQADMSREHWQSIRDLCSQSAAAINLPGNLRAEVAGGVLSIALQSNK